MRRESSSRDKAVTAGLVEKVAFSASVKRRSSSGATGAVSSVFFVVDMQVSIEVCVRPNAGLECDESVRFANRIPEHSWPAAENPPFP